MAYSFRTAYESGAFLQRDLVDGSGLHNLARKGGIEVPAFSSSFAELLEELDEVGAFCPIAFGPQGYEQARFHSLLGRPELVFRDEAGWEPWQTYAYSDDVRDRVTALYSPWQLLYLPRALEMRTMPVVVQALRDPRQAAAAARKFAEIVDVHYEVWTSLDAGWKPLVLLLVRLQNRYWPLVGTWTMPIDPNTRTYVNPLPAERRRFRARKALAELELDVHAVHAYYERLAFNIQNIDPIPDWWIARRSVTRARSERMKGKARQVETLWDAAQVLRLFYRALTRRVLPDADKVGWDPDSIRRVLGHEPRMYYDRGDLTRFLERQELYPNQVHLFVEGDCEEAMFPRLLEALRGPVEAEGVRLTNLRGIDNLDRRYRELFEGFAAYARHAFLVADREGRIGRYVAELQKDGLIDAAAVWLWQRNLEEDNFSDGELVRAARAAAREAGGELKGLHGTTLRASYERRRQLPSGGPATVVDELLRLCRHPEHGSVPITKKQLAAKLTDILLGERRDASSWESLRRRRPIYVALERLLQFIA
jgi:hypothetical protein